MNLFAFSGYVLKELRVSLTPDSVLEQERVLS